MVSPLVQFLGVEEGDMIGHKRFLALFAGGMLPLISLSFLHMLVKFEEEEKKKRENLGEVPLNIDELSLQAGKMEAELDKEKLNASSEELGKLEEVLNKLNEAKFGNLEEPLKAEDVNDSNIEQNKKVLSYLRSHG